MESDHSFEQVRFKVRQFTEIIHLVNAKTTQIIVNTKAIVKKTTMKVIYKL